MIYSISQNFVNECLKCNKDVDKLKKYNCILEMIIIYAKHRHSLIILTYFNLIIYIFKIEINKFIKRFFVLLINID